MSVEVTISNHWDKTTTVPEIVKSASWATKLGSVTGGELSSVVPPAAVAALGFASSTCDDDIYFDPWRTENAIRIRVFITLMVAGEQITVGKGLAHLCQHCP